MVAGVAARGVHTREEVFSQPQVWAECLRALKDKSQIAEVRKRLVPAAEWLFVGCGSSYYIAQAAAASWTARAGSRGRAVPASELLLYPELVLGGASALQPVLISRSGHTSEILRVAEWLELKKNMRTLAISCATHQPLEATVTACLYVLPADEQSMVMTRSFTSMLLALQMLAAAAGGQSAYAASLNKLPQQAAPLVETLPNRIEEFVNSHIFADYVFLGQGPYFGIASEAMLKVKEMSCSYAQCFHTLEFRHGPKAIVSRETLLTFFLSEAGYEAEREVLEEVKGLGGTTLVVTNRADSATRRAADLLVELNLDVDEYARLAPALMTGQLLGFFTGVKKGYDPDRPRNLSRVVILKNNG